MASKLAVPPAGDDETGEVTMFAAIKSLIPEPRHENHPRGYVGRHRNLDVTSEADTLATMNNPAEEADSVEDRPATRDPQPPSGA